MTVSERLGDPEPLLIRPGRASNPPVNTTAYPLRLADLAASAPQGDPSRRVIGVLSEESRAIVGRYTIVVDARPGMTVDLLTPGIAQMVVVDQAAFADGPWLGAGDGGDVHLVRELAELLRAATRGGGTGVFVGDSFPTEVTAWLAGAADLALPFPADHPNLVEGAPLPPVLNELNDLAKERSER